MIHSLSGKVVDLLIKRETIKEDEKDIYLYGAKQFFTLLLNLIFPLTFAIYQKIALQVITFIILALLLRCNAGGYHAKSGVGCFIISQVASFAMMLIILYFKFISTSVIIVFSLLSFAVIYILSPVEAANNPLNEKEAKVYRKKAMRFSGAFTMICIGTTLVFRPLASPFFVCILLVAISQVHAQISQKKTAVATNKHQATL